MNTSGMPQAHITECMTGEQTPLTETVARALQTATRREGKLGPPLLAMPGASGQLYRYFINNLVQYLPDARYLEVGSWTGSTMCAAIFGNTLRAFAIDDWSEFGGPSGLFLQHVGQCMSKDIQFSMLSQDFRRVNYSAIGKFNVYLFDGPHEEQDQHDGLFLAQEALDDEFVFIVDDWNWDRVRAGTKRAISSIKLEVLHGYEILTSLDGKPPPVGMEQSEWHNGYLLSVLRKPNS